MTLGADNFREWVRQQSARNLSDYLTQLATELRERGWMAEAGELMGVVARLVQRREG